MPRFSLRFMTLCSLALTASSTVSLATTSDGSEGRLAAGQVSRIAIEDVAVHFHKGASSLDRSDKARLTHFVELFVGGLSDLSVRIVADDDGRPTSLLGWRRALAVQDFLVSKGLHAQCIELATEPSGRGAAVLTYLGTCP
jgi:outer membrane protein OmpA-like peptidoglycan-associated protein